DGGGASGPQRVDRFLPAIAALIDPRQVELISRPTSGLLVVQGSAGSGKATIGLHGVAYDAVAAPRRSEPDKMLVVFYHRALAAAVGQHADAAAALEAWDVSSGPVDMRVSALARWSKEATLAPASRNALEGAGHKLRARTRDVVGEWAALLTDRRALGEGF